MILERLHNWMRRPETKTATLKVGTRAVPLLLVRHPRARRYLLRLRADGTARVTIPRGGNIAAAMEFAQRNAGWLEREYQRQAARLRIPAGWTAGTEILFRGTPVRLAGGTDGTISFGGERLKVADVAGDLRPAIEKHLRQLAEKELPARVLELAVLHGVNVGRVTVRNQKTRWGSCSRRGNISLNWRLIQAPDQVRDYIILHELAHRRQMNHSDKFWQEVARLCANYQLAERWLKQHSRLLR